jgi:hypothetical protein
LATGLARGRCHLKDDKLQFERDTGVDMKRVSNLVKEAGSTKSVLLGTAQDGDKLFGKELGAKFEGEDNKTGWRTEDPALKDSDKHTTKYDRPEDRENSRAIPNPNKGRLEIKDETKQGGKTGFVMDPKTGQVHTFKPGDVSDLGDGKKQYTHHSTPLGGAPVAGAGHLVTEYDRIKEIHDDSGHYKPSAEFTLQVVKQLEALGVSLRDNKTLRNAKGKDVTPEYRQKYKQIQARVAELESELKKQKTTPEGKFDPNPDLIGLRAEIQKQLVELRALGVAPVNKPAKVQLQGKIGLTEEEFQTAKEDVAKINAILEKKPGGRKDLLPANTPPGTLRSLEALNLKIGEALKVTLTTEQFGQTGGNEQAIRAKAQAVALLNERAKTGLTAEEFQGAKGNLAKINDILEKKTRRKNFLPADTDPTTLQNLDTLNLKIREALKRPALKPVGEAKTAIEAERAAMAARKTAAKPKSLQELIIEAGGEKAIIKLGFPASDLEYLSDDDKLAFLRGEIDLDTAKERAGSF